MDTLQSTYLSSGPLIRPELSPRMDITQASSSSALTRRVPPSTMPVARLGIRSGANSDLTASTALNSLLQLPPGSTVQLSLTSEGNRYDKLKYAAENMVREQISVRSEREFSESKVSLLESTIQSQSAKIQKLRTEKSQLQSHLELEKATISKLDFECRSLQTMVDGLNSQVSQFERKIDLAHQDAEKFRIAVSAYHTRMDHLEEKTTEFRAQREAEIVERDKMRIYLEGRDQLLATMEASLEEERALKVSLEEDQVQLKATLAELEAQILLAKNEEAIKSSTLERSIAELRQTLEATESSLAEERACKASIEAEAAQYKACMETFKGSLEEAKKEEKLRSKLMDGRIADLKAKLSITTSSLTVQIEDKQKEMEQLVHKIEELSELVTTTAYGRTAALKEASESKKDLKEFQKAADEQLVEITAKLEEAEIVLEQNRQQLLQRDQQIEQLTAQLKTYQEEGKRSGSTHRSELTELKRSMLGLVTQREEEISKLKSEVSSLNQQLSLDDRSAQDKLTLLQEKMASVEQKARLEIDRQRELHSQELTRRTSVEEALRSAQKEIDSLSITNRKALSELEDMKREAERVQQSIAEAQHLVELRMKDMLKEEEEKLSACEEQIMQLKTSNQLLEAEVERKQQKVQRLKSKLLNRSTTSVKSSNALNTSTPSSKIRSARDSSSHAESSTRHHSSATRDSQRDASDYPFKPNSPRVSIHQEDSEHSGVKEEHDAFSVSQARSFSKSHPTTPIPTAKHRLSTVGAITETSGLEALYEKPEPPHTASKLTSKPRASVRTPIAAPSEITATAQNKVISRAKETRNTGMTSTPASVLPTRSRPAPTSADQGHPKSILEISPRKATPSSTSDESNQAPRIGLAWGTKGSKEKPSSAAPSAEVSPTKATLKSSPQKSGVTFSQLAKKGSPTTSAAPRTKAPVPPRQSRASAPDTPAPKAKPTPADTNTLSTTSSKVSIRSKAPVKSSAGLGILSKATSASSGSNSVFESDDLFSFH